MILEIEELMQPLNFLKVNLDWKIERIRFELLHEVQKKPWYIFILKILNVPWNNPTQKQKLANHPKNMY